MASDMTQWVNPLQGTDSTHSHSHGNTLPLVGMPFAMTSWSLQTSEDRWFFHPSAPKLQGIRATRQPSPWIGDYGHFTLMPQVGERLLAANRRASSYRLSDATILPHWMRVKLLRYETTVEIAATERCAVLVVHFPTGTSPKRLILDTFPGESRVEIDAANGCVRGHTRAHSAGDPKGFAGHFLLKFDCPLNPDDTGLFADGRVFAGQCAGTGDRSARSLACCHGTGRRWWSGLPPPSFRRSSARSTWSRNWAGAHSPKCATRQPRLGTAG